MNSKDVVGLEKLRKPGDIRVWYIPQIPMPAFRVDVPDLATAKTVLDALSFFSLFEFNHQVKPDYCDAGGVERWEMDGEGGYGWFEVDFEYEDL